MMMILWFVWIANFKATLGIPSKPGLQSYCMLSSVMSGIIPSFCGIRTCSIELSVGNSVDIMVGTNFGQVGDPT